MNDTTAIVLGVAIVVVGYLAYKAMQPPPPAAGASSSGFGLLAPFTQLAATRLGEALDGEREWW
jgi:hypothetical protein